MENTLTLILILTLTLTCGCGKKASSSVADKGPAFAVQSQDLKWNIVGPTDVTLRRDEPSYGPELQIQPDDAAHIVTAEKKLQCASLDSIEGKRVSARDVKLFSFHISEEDFPGLGRLPMSTPCKVQVTLYNNIGSTWTKEVSVLVHYDKPPKLNISHFYAIVGELPDNQSGDFPLESYSIVNDLNYPIGFTYKPQINGKGALSYSVNRGAVRMYGISVPFEGNVIDLSNNADFVSGDFINEVKFFVKPGDTVTVTSVFHIPRNLMKQVRVGATSKDGLAFENAGAIFIGMEADAISGLGALYVWRGLQFSNDDRVSPVPVSPVSNQTEPGSYPLPNWPFNYDLLSGSPLN